MIDAKINGLKIEKDTVYHLNEDNEWVETPITYIPIIESIKLRLERFNFPLKTKREDYIFEKEHNTGKSKIKAYKDNDGEMTIILDNAVSKSGIKEFDEDVAFQSDFNSKPSRSAVSKAALSTTKDKSKKIKLDNRMIGKVQSLSISDKSKFAKRKNSGEVDHISDKRINYKAHLLKISLKQVHQHARTSLLEQLIVIPINFRRVQPLFKSNIKEAQMVICSIKFNQKNQIQDFTSPFKIKIEK
ncbi:hypothetical protein A0H76_2175 [Hepatospora eriocheir]|uniref:Uncharacterized protein n=1 Tax=Hepatospora eriocheir TaxID=1081669 RepID=A0A1X0QK43_9MICR|nr:hypothetical protein A0H76_2175 [Hepatospora eriocheir]